MAFCILSIFVSQKGCCCLYQADAGFAVLQRGVRVVSYADANFGLDEPLLQVPGADHISISKPVARTDTAYLVVFSFIHRTVKQTPVSPMLSPLALLAQQSMIHYWSFLALLIAIHCHRV